MKSRLIGKESNAGKDRRQEEKRATDDEMVGWYHWLNGHESEQTPGEGEGQGSLVCYSPLGCKVWYGWVTEQLGFCFLLTDLRMVWGGGFRSVHVQLWLLLSAAQRVCTALWPPWPQEGSSWLSPLFLSVKLLTALLFGLLLLVSWSYELLLNCFLTRCQLFFPFIYLFILGCTMQLMES